jgi:hypothetical protein
METDHTGRDVFRETEVDQETSTMTKLVKMQILFGERFRVGAFIVKMDSIRSRTSFVLAVYKSMVEKFEITDRLPVEIITGVKVKAGNGDRPYRAWVILEVPESMEVERFNKEPDSVRFGGPRPRMSVDA